MGISTRYIEKDLCLQIEVSGDFNFAVHQAFRAAYQRRDLKVGKYQVNLQATQSLDSSALGMLLLLRDWAGGDAPNIELMNPSAEVQKILRLANFDDLFVIPSLKLAKEREQASQPA